MLVVASEDDEGQDTRSSSHLARIAELENELLYLRKQIRNLDSIQQRNIQLERKAQGYERRCEELQRVVSSFEKERARSGTSSHQNSPPPTATSISKSPQSANDMPSSVIDEASLGNIKKIPPSLVTTGVETPKEEQESSSRPQSKSPISNVIPHMLSSMKTRYNLMKTISKVSRRVVRPSGSKQETPPPPPPPPLVQPNQAFEHSFPLTLDDVDDVAHDGWSSLRQESSMNSHRQSPNAILSSRSNSELSTAASGVGGLNTLVEASHKLIAGSDAADGGAPEGLTRYLLSDRRPVDEYFIKNRPVGEWTADQVCKWLCTVGLSSYAQTFLERNVNGDRLLQLDQGKLKTLGLKSSKQRDHVRLLIKKLRENDKHRKTSAGTNTGCVQFGGSA
ncbi:hypothetical protein ACOME3_010828 [Neoechinorhynchus agilis]